MAADTHTAASSPGPANLFVGATRDCQCRRTLKVFEAKLRGLSPLVGGRVLDVGCGEGSFTLALTSGYRSVFAIDVQEASLRAFREEVRQDPRYGIFCMSASQMAFPSDYFDTILSLETLEHIPDLVGAIREFGRVLIPGGDCVITCPNRLFPFENHGMRWGGKEYHGRVPLLPYLPPLHDRLSLARVFSVRVLDRLFLPQGFKRVGLDYLWPTFEHGGNPAQGLLRPLYGLMRRLERSPFRRFGSSVVVRYVKQELPGGRAGDSQAPLLS